jgi:hypothetical protein
MKTANMIKAILLGSSLAVALALATPQSAQSQEKGSARGGATQLLKPIKTVQDLEGLKAGDAVVMSCPKCKTMTISYVERTKGQVTEEKIKQEHLCPGCETKIETTGFGKAKKDQVVHVCKKCGSEDVMCCALKKSTGPTKGMEEKK